MDNIETNKLSIDPRNFALWISRVATINEGFSETLRDTADEVVAFDVNAARNLYRAADAASLTVQQLRRSMPPPIHAWSRGCWFCVGILAGFIVHRLL